MEQCVRKNIENRIEFRFLGAGGSAVGPMGIAIFALLCVVAIAVLAALIVKLGSVAPVINWMAWFRPP